MVMVVHTFNPKPQEAEIETIIPCQTNLCRHFQDNQSYIVRSCLKQKKKEALKGFLKIAP